MSTQTIFRTAGSTSQSTMVNLVQNAASTAPGDPILNLAYNTTNLVCYYKTGGTGTLTQISLVTLANDTAAYSAGGFVKVSDTLAPGMYRFDIPAAVIANVGERNIIFSGGPAGTVGNMETHTVKIITTSLDFYTTAYSQVMTTQMTESYAATTVVPTPAQALQMCTQALLGFAGSGTTLTVYQRDNATTAMVGTWDASTNATSLKQTT